MVFQRAVWIGMVQPCLRGSVRSTRVIVRPLTTSSCGSKDYHDMTRHGRSLRAAAVVAAGSITGLAGVTLWSSNSVSNEAAQTSPSTDDRPQERASLSGDSSCQPSIATGKCYLVGAGPGKADLITLRGLRILEQADVVVHDELIDMSLLNVCRSDAIIVSMGKRGGRVSTKQADINQTLVEHTKAGKAVVRLKGGDPLVFGRIAEELAALAAAGCKFEIVPGVSSILAAPAAVGMPLTHKIDSTAVLFLSGHDPDSMDFDVLAKVDTLVFVMATRTLSDIVDALVEHGRPSTTPVTIIKNADLESQQVLTGTLGSIVENTAGLKLSPSVIVIGKVAASLYALSGGGSKV